MKTETMGSRWFGRFGVALGALSLGLLVTGCEPECVDQFDCVRQGNPGEGKRYVCEDDRCVVRDVTPDAGTEPEDSGTTDAGTEDAGTEDAGTDAGVACADLPHDPKLGTLQLQEGFAAATETATLPEGIGAVTALQDGAEFKLYGLRGTDIYALGSWPNVALGDAPLQSIYAEADRDASITRFPNGYLANDGTRLLAGYTKPGSDFSNIPGTVLVYDTVTPASSTYLAANGNFTAAGLDGGFLLNAQGLEGVAEGGNAIYALRTESSPFQGSKLATFPVSTVSSGFTAVATNGVAVLGYSDTAQNYANFLRAVAPATYTPAFTGGTTLALTSSNAPEIYADTAFPGLVLKDVAAFGEGVALQRGTYTTTQDVSRIPLPLGGVTPEAVTPGDLKSVLTTSNACTNVVLMAPLGEDLLLGVTDKNGRRLVRLTLQ